MVIDYRSLNEKTISDAYPLPNICEILNQLGGAKYFSTLDLASGFHQIPMDPDSQSKTAFCTSYGHYEYKRMPFGLKNAPSTFQRMMDQVLSGIQGVELFVYMDDIVVYSSSLEEHANKLKKLLGRLQTAGLTLQPEKSHFLQKQIAYLGHVITQYGVKPDPRKIEAVQKFSRPKTRKNIKQFLGLIGYYRRSIPGFAKLAKPRTHLTKLGVKFHWEKSQQEAFKKLRDIIITEPILQYPNFSKPFIVTTDASDYAIGAILIQGEIGQDLPVSYASRTLTDAETKYATIEKELLAILFGVENFRPYPYGRKFTLVTDHRPFVWLHNIMNPGSKLNRWRLRLGEYDYSVVYKSGRVNANADVLSRNPVNPNKNHKVDVIEATENIICRFGCPRIIHTDQGSNFLSQIMKIFCQISKIRQVRSTAFHPQSLGALERSHHVFVEYLRHYCSNYNWDQWLKFAMFSYNSTVHSATGLTPHRLVFGEEGRIPSEFETGEVSITYNEYLENLLFKIYEAQATARENIKQAKLKYKYYYDQKSQVENYEIGEYVYLQKEPRTSKLDDHYEGPYEVTNVFTDHNVKIAITDNKRKIVHKNKIKLAHLRANLEQLD